MASTHSIALPGDRAGDYVTRMRFCNDATLSLLISAIQLKTIQLRAVRQLREGGRVSHRHSNKRQHPNRSG